MDTKDTALLAKLRGLFGMEAEERLQVITSSLLALEQQPSAQTHTELVETLFREVHTLKGAARAVSLSDIEAISQAVENVCAGLKRKTVTAGPELFDTFHRAMDLVRQLSAAPEGVTAQQIADVLAAITHAEEHAQGPQAWQAQQTQSAPPTLTFQQDDDVPSASQLMTQGTPSTITGEAQDSLLAKLRGLFGMEAEERLQVITSSLLALEQQPSAQTHTELVETLFREVHTLKGAARAVSLSDIEAISQAVENVCAGLKRKTVTAGPELFDTFHRAMDLVRQLSAAPEGVTAQQIADVLAAITHAEEHAQAQSALPTPALTSIEQFTSATPTTPEPAQTQIVEALQPVEIHEDSAANDDAPSPKAKKKRLPRAAAAPRQTAARQPRAAKKKATIEPSVALNESEAAASGNTEDNVQLVDINPHETLAASEPVEVAAPEPTPVQPPAAMPQLERLTPPLATARKLEPLVDFREKVDKNKKKKSGATSTETVRIEASKLDALFLQAEEMLTVKLKTNEHASELRELGTMLEAWKREWAKVHMHLRKAQGLVEKEENRTSPDPIYAQTAKLVEFLNWTQDHFRIVDRTLTRMVKGLAKDQQSLGSMVDILLEDAKKILLMPFASALEVLPRMVRDLSRTQGKEVEFMLQGEEVEIDKRILEAIKDPLIHLLRNCIDHGIELPAERAQWSKAPRGSLSVAIAPSDGNTVEIIVSDDGAGIDVEKVKKAAVACDALSQEAAALLSDQEAIALIFQSEVSTSDAVSDISGRGLGMAIVREKVEKLGGSIAVETQLHQGTTFRLRLPLTLATFRGILVQIAGQAFIAPTANVERMVRVKRGVAIQTSGGKETLSLAGYTLPFTQLDRVLGLASPMPTVAKERFQLALVVGQDERQVAFGVDAVMDEQEVLFKSLGQQLVRVRNIAGATVLGSGQIVPILNINDLLAAVNTATFSSTKVIHQTPKADLQKKKILVAEDSITSRMLLKEILESAGYVVSTAIDGEDAFTTLQKNSFDLVVSDVEMPRVDGFSLTGKIRSDERYTQLPVVLVTGLESQGDRERGVAVGASAYVVKGSFDQSNLLETIRRLI